VNIFFQSSNIGYAVLAMFVFVTFCVYTLSFSFVPYQALPEVP